ncbi:MAG: DUF3817 domain-containing protein [Thermonemataceae bacterium]|nr:DUF3817 domain-containing protein [Thermonemataceae bacterium]
MKTLPFFEKVAHIEGVSYLLFAITMPIKYLLKIPQPNYVVGSAHGILFVLYCLLLLKVWIELKWSFVKVLTAFLVSLLPFGTFWAAKKGFYKH